MNVAHRLPRLLRLTAALVLTVTLATWLNTGAHRGWTRTSITEIRHDKVIGIDFPVDHAKFVAGVEVLAAGVGLAGALGLASLLLAHRNRRQATTR